MSDLLWTVLTTVGSILFGLSWCVAYYVIHNKQIREAIIGDCISSLTRTVLSNPAILTIITSVQSWLTPDRGPSHQEASLINRDTVMSIPFTFQEQEFILLVPYDRVAARRDVARFSVSENGQRERLSHCPGIPFIITAEQLSCERIEEAEDEF